MILRAPHPTALKPVFPNAGVEAAYRRELIAMVDALHAGLLSRVLRRYRQLPGIAEDDLSPSQLTAEMQRYGDEWMARLSKQAGIIARRFVEAGAAANDAIFGSALRAGGFTVKLQVTPAMQAEMDRVIGANVKLIKSIAEDHLADVQQGVLEAFNVRKSAKDLVEELGSHVSLRRKLSESDKSYLARTRRRAEFIARDQNNKLNAAITRVRQRGFGLKKAQWLHSAASVHPREEHEAFSGEEYDIEVGHDFDDGLGPVLPGEAYNCGCVSVTLVPGFDDAAPEPETESEEEAA